MLIPVPKPKFEFLPLKDRAMTAFKKRLATQGITLEQFAFQFVVVLLGVYLAIVFENKAEARALEADARAMLVNVLQEIKQDEVEMDTVLAKQEEIERASEALRELLVTASTGEEVAIDSILRGALSFNPTVFPRRAAYSALIGSGLLGAISSDDLSLNLANLYEHHYVRLINFGQIYDKNYLEEFYFYAHTHWDYSGRRLIQRGGDENVLFRNAAESNRIFAENYRSQLSQVLADLKLVKGSIETYLPE